VVWLGGSARKEKNKEKEGLDLVCFYVTICFHVWYTFRNDRKEGSGKLVWHDFCCIYVMDWVCTIFA
jgi:hypothetical protein